MKLFSNRGHFLFYAVTVPELQDYSWRNNDITVV